MSTSTQIITGYTGERHITPNMDAMINNSIWGNPDEAVVIPYTGGLEGSMPSINQFSLGKGIVAFEGRYIQHNAETLVVETCASGYVRKDRVVMRYTKDVASNVERVETILLKGTAVQRGNTPASPTIKTGSIISGSTNVDIPLYTIMLDGSTVSFKREVNEWTRGMGGIIVSEKTIEMYKALGMEV
nr:MAG TPA: hypothetical protein [Caudoviricetes sp.]